MRRIHCLLITALLLIYSLSTILNNYPHLKSQNSIEEWQKYVQNSLFRKVYLAFIKASSKAESAAQTTKAQNLIGKRIAISIRTSDSHNLSLNLQKTIDSLRDTCESGATISVTIYSIRPYNVETINLLNSRIKCRNKIGKISMEIKLINLSFKETERYNYDTLFMKHLNNYDLFIYMEDHIYLKMRHILSYFVEIERLEGLLPKNQFADHTIGFSRYGIDKTKPKHQITCDHLHSISNDYLKSKYIAIQPLDDIYMATPTQLRQWNNRCNHHESNALFCNVKHVIPSDYFEDFILLDTTYPMHDTCQTSFQLQSMRLTKFETNTIQKNFVNERNEYNGVIMEVDDTRDNLMKALVKNKAYLNELDKIMGQYEEYSSNGGKFYFYKGSKG